MTWDELKAKAKEMGYLVVKRIPYGEEIECIVNDKDYRFYKDGFCEFGCTADDLFGRPFAEERTPEQMLMIMRGLE